MQQEKASIKGHNVQQESKQQSNDYINDPQIQAQAQWDLLHTAPERYGIKKTDESGNISWDLIADDQDYMNSLFDQLPEKKQVEEWKNNPERWNERPFIQQFKTVADEQKSVFGDNWLGNTSLAAGNVVEGLNAGGAAVGGGLSEFIHQNIEKPLFGWISKKQSDRLAFGRLADIFFEDQAYSSSAAGKHNTIDDNGNIRQKDFIDYIKEGDFGRALGDLSLGAIESAPTSAIAIGATMAGSPQLGLSLIGAQVAGTRKRELDKNNPELSELQKNLIAYGSGAIEAGSELLGDIPIGKMLGKIYKTGGTAVAEHVMRNSVDGIIKATTKQLKNGSILWKAPFAEGGEEFASGIGNYLLDSANGIQQFNLNEMLSQSAKQMAYGTVAGGGFGLVGTPGLIRNAKVASTLESLKKEYDKANANLKKSFDDSEFEFDGEKIITAPLENQRQVLNAALQAENLTTEQKTAIRDYMQAGNNLNAALINVGLTNIELLRKKANAVKQIEEQTNEKTGTVDKITIQGIADTENYTVKSGTVILDEDGKVNKQQSDEAIYYYTGNTNEDGTHEVNIIPAENINAIQSEDPKRILQQSFMQIEAEEFTRSEFGEGMKVQLNTDIGKIPGTVVAITQTGLVVNVQGAESEIPFEQAVQDVEAVSDNSQEPVAGGESYTSIPTEELKAQYKNINSALKSGTLSEQQKNEAQIVFRQIEEELAKRNEQPLTTQGQTKTEEPVYAPGTTAVINGDTFVVGEKDEEGNYLINDKDGNLIDRFTPEEMKEFGFSVAVKPPTAEQETSLSGNISTVEPYPTNKKGEIDFDAMTVTQTYRYMQENYGEEEAQKGLGLQERNIQALISQNIKDQKKTNESLYGQLRNAQTIQEQLKIREKNKSTLNKLTEERASLDAQLGEIRSLMPQVEQIPEQPEIKPATRSNVRPEEQFRREQEAKTKAASVENDNNLTPSIENDKASTASEINQQPVIEVRKKQKSNTINPWQKRLNNLGDAMTVEDIVLRHIAAGTKFIWDSPAPNKGLAQELGFVNKPGEREARKNMIDDKNGITPQEFAHKIFESGDVDFMGNIDGQEVYNVVVDTLLHINNATEALEMAENLRDSRDFSENEQAEWDSITTEEKEYLESIPDDILQSYLGITNFTPEQLDIIQNLQNNYYENTNTTTTETGAINSLTGVESEKAATATERQINQETVKVTNQPSESDAKEQTHKYKNGDTVYYRGKPYVINGIYNGELAYDLETLKGKTAYEEIEEAELSNDVQFQVIEKENNLVVLHNIKAEGILNADKLGALPMPSLAITKSDTPLTGYGEITLIGDKRMVDPQQGARTFGSDIYSSRYPNLTYTISKQGKKIIQQAVKILPAELQASVWYGIEQAAEDGKKGIIDSNSLKTIFLAEEGKLDEILEREKTEYSQQTIDAISSIEGYDYLDIVNDEKVRKQLTDIFFAENPTLEKYRKRFTDENGILNDNNSRQLFDGVKRYIRVANKIDNINTFRNASNYIVKNNMEAKWRKWATDFYDKLDIKEEIFKGYNNQGNRKYVAHTIDNVMKTMKTKNLRGAEQFFYGTGSIRARITPEFKSITDIKDNAGKLTDKETIEKVKDEVDNKLTALKETLEPFFKFKGNKIGVFEESLANEIVTLANKGQSESFDVLDKEARTKLIEFIEMVKNAPTEYFETKPTRKVYLSEFTAAIVPEDTDPKVLAILENAGLKVERYTDNRSEVVRRVAERENVQFQSISPIGFYSTVEKALESIQQEKGTKDQFKAMLLKNGAKQAEMDWMGFDELPEKLTKTDVQKWIDENRIDIQEVNLTLNENEDKELRNELENVVDEMVGDDIMDIEIDTDVETREFFDISEPIFLEDGYYLGDADEEIMNDIAINKGYEDYSELFDAMDIYFTDLKKEKIDSKRNQYLSKIRSKNNEGEKQYQKYSLPGGENYRELLLTLPRIKDAGTFKQFHTSKYYADAPILAHIRFDERTVNGERVLFIEEIQSDWAQKGKKEGFSNKKLIQRENKIQAEMETLRQELDVLRNKDAAENNNGIRREANLLEWASKYEPEKNNKMATLLSELNSIEEEKGSIPDMPFKKTDQWVTLAARRMMRYAAENGFDRIAWTTGEQQADRYDLSKSVDRIVVDEDGGKYTVMARPKGEPELKEIAVCTKDNLSDYIGKDLASKAIEQGGGDFTGDNLKVGGSGMKAFYDAIVPSAMSKLGKPFGVKVETIEIPETGTQQSLPVTDSMKRSAMEGLPLYHAGNAFQPITEDQFTKLTTILNKAFGGKVKTTTDIEEFANGNKNIIQQLRNVKGQIYGAVTQDGTIYINSERLNANTPIHEYGHLLNAIIRQTDKSLWKNIVRSIQQTDEWNEVKNDPNYSNLTTEDEIADEAFAKLLGNIGEGKWEDIVENSKNKTALAKLKEYIEEFFNKIKEIFGVSKYDDLNAEEIAGITLEKLLSGEPITQRGKLNSIKEQFSHLFSSITKNNAELAYLGLNEIRYSTGNEFLNLEQKTNLYKKEFGETAARLIRSNMPIAFDHEKQLIAYLKEKIPIKSNMPFILKNIGTDIEKEFLKQLSEKGENAEDAGKYTTNPAELLKGAGYTFTPTPSGNDILNFRMYYPENGQNGVDVICTFNDPYARAKNNFVSFIVKEDANETVEAEKLTQDNLSESWKKYLEAQGRKNPDGTYNLSGLKNHREDPFSTSVLSIQISKDGKIIKIISRYNHTIHVGNTNPDATYGSDLNKIAEGLNESIANYFNIKLNKEQKFDLPDGITRDNKGRYFNYAKETNGVYWGGDFYIKNGQAYINDLNSERIVDEFIINNKGEIKNITNYSKSFLFGQPTKVTFLKGGKIEMTTEKGNITFTTKNGIIDSIEKIDKQIREHALNKLCGVSYTEDNKIILKQIDANAASYIHLLWGNDIVKISDWAAFNNSKLTSLGELKSIGGTAYFSNSQLTSLGALESIGEKADFSNSQLTSLGVLKSIGGDADFSDSQLTSLSELKSIGGNANFNDSQLTSLGILESIGGKADFSYSQLTSLGALTSIGETANFINSQLISLGELTSIGGSAYFSDSQLTSLSELKSIGGNANFNDSQLTSLGALTSIGGNANFMDSQLTSLGKLNNIGGAAYFRDSQLTSLGALTSIGGKADFSDSQLTSLGALTSIGETADFINSQLISLGELTSIGGSAYFRDSQLTSLGKLNNIGGAAYFNGSKLTSLGKLKSIGETAYFNDSQLTSLGELKSIGGDADFRDSQLTSLGALKSIGRNANFSNSQLTSLGELESIGGHADFSNSQLTSLGALKIIGGSAEFNESKLTSLSKLKIIGRNANFSFSQLTSLGELNSIGGNANFNYSQLTSLDKLKSIGGNAEFMDNQLTSLGELKCIGGYANFNETKLTSLGELKSIGGEAYFYNNKKELFAQLKRNDPAAKELAIQIQSETEAEVKREIEASQQKAQLHAGNSIQPTTTEEVAEIVEQLLKTGLAKEVRMITPEEIESILDGTEQKQIMQTPTGAVYGFVKGGVVYLNSSTPNLNTPIHEFGHLWIDAIEGSNLYNRGAELVKDTPYWKSVNADPNYKNLSESERIKEAMAQAIGDKGEAIKRNIGLFAQIRAWITDVWQHIGSKFGIQNLTPAQIENLTFNDFVNVAASELLSGKKLTKQTPLTQNDGKDNLNETNLHFQVESNKTGKNKLSLQAPNIISKSNENYYEYKTQSGETIPYIREQLSLFPVETTGNDLQQQEDSKRGTTDSYWDSDPNAEDVTHFERLMSEQKHIKLSGDTHIRSSRDIAYLFRSLESKPTENIFVVLINKNGTYKVLYLSSGSTDASIVDVKLIAAAAKEFGSDRICLVHNHPSGQLAASLQDFNMQNKIIKAMNGIAQVLPGVIINLDSGKYVEFDENTQDILETRVDKPTKEVSAKVYAFDRQKLYTKTSNLSKIKDSSDVAVAISKFKRGTDDKFIVIVVNSGNVIVRTFLTTDISAATLLPIIGKHGNSVILGGNVMIPADELKKINSQLKAANTQILDYLCVGQSTEILESYKSYADEGKLYEPKPEYTGQPIAEYAEEIDQYNEKASEYANKGSKMQRLQEIMISKTALAESHRKKEISNQEYAKQMLALHEERQRILKGIEEPTIDKTEIDDDDPKPTRIPGQSIAEWAKVIADWNYRQTLNKALAKTTSDITGGLPPVEQDTEINNELLRLELDQRLGGFFGRLVEGWQDNIRSVRIFQDLLKEKGTRISDFNNFYMQYTALQGKNDGHLNDFGKRYMAPLNANLLNIQKYTNYEYRDLENYVFLKHGLERNEYMREEARKAAETEGKKFKERDDYSGIYAIAAELYAKINGLPFDPSKKGEVTKIQKLENFKAERDAIIANYIAEFEKTISETMIPGNVKGEQLTLNSFWSAINAATNYTLDRLVSSGINTKAEIDELKSRYKYYIPLRGHEVEAEKIWPYESPDNKNVVSNAIIKASGRGTRAEHPFAYIIQMAQTNINKANRNQLNQTMLRLGRIDKSGLMTVSEAWYVLTGTDELTGKEIWTETEPEFSEDHEIQNGEIAAWNEKMKQLEVEGKAKRFNKGLRIGDLFIKPKQKRQHAIPIYEDGVLYQVYINGNPRVSHAINELNNRMLDNFAIIKGIRSTTRFVSSMITSRSPQFMLTNGARDLVFASTILPSKEGANYTAQFFKNYPIAIAVLTNDVTFDMGNDGALYKKYLREFEMNGGETGYSHLLEIRDIQNELYKKQKGKNYLNPLTDIDALVNVIDTGNRVIENSTRLAVYITSRKNGRSIERSVSDSKEVTLNFNRRGSGTMGAAEVQAMFMFVNAGVQALANFGHVYKMHPVRMSATIGMFASVGFLLPMIIRMIGGDDDEKEYMKMSNWERQTNLCLPTGTGGFAKIPLPQELRIFYKLGDETYQLMSGRTEMIETAMNTLKSAADMIPISPLGTIAAGEIAGFDDLMRAISPDAIRGIAELATNTNFMSGQIFDKYKAEKAEMPGYQKARLNRIGEPRAPESVVGFTKWLDHLTGGNGVEKGKISLNPDVVNHLAKSYLGGMYSLIAEGGRSFTTRFYTSSADIEEKNTTIKDYYNRIREADEIIRQQKGYMEKLQTGEISETEYIKEVNPIKVDRANIINDYEKAITRIERLLKTGELTEDDELYYKHQSDSLKREVIKIKIK